MNNVLVCLVAGLLTLFAVLPAEAQPSKRILKSWNKGQYEKCLSQCRKALEKDHRDLDALLYKARTLAALDQAGNKTYKSGTEQAVRSLAMLKKKDRDGSFLAQQHTIISEIVDAALRESELLTEAGQERRAKKLMERLAAVADQPATQMGLAHWHYTAGDYAKASRLFHEMDASMLDALAWERMLDADLQSGKVADFKAYDQALLAYPEAEALQSLGYRMLEGATFYDFTKAEVLLAHCEKYAARFPTDERFNDLYWEKAGELLTQRFRALDVESNEGLVALLNDLTYGPDGKATGFDGAERLLNNLAVEVTVSNTEEQRKRYSPRLLGMVKGWFGKRENIQDEVTSVVAYIDRQFGNENLLSAASFTWHGRHLHTRSRDLKKREEQLVEHLEALPSGDNVQLVQLESLSEMFPEMKRIGSLRRSLYLESLSSFIQDGDFSNAARVLRHVRTHFPEDREFLAMRKQFVIADYQASYERSATQRSDLGWVSHGDCDPGKIPQEFHDKVLERLQYLRRLAGVPDDVRFDEEWNKKCQAAAFMMKANGKLDHTPTKAWDCYSELGYKGASTSNLSMGTDGSNSLMGQMRDYGSHNTAVGHRRWILYPRKKVFGHGSVPGYMALGCLGHVGDGLTAEERAYYKETPVCWPPADYVPTQFVYPRWSFSLTQAGFENAKVTLLDGRKKVSCKVIHRGGSYGQSTIAFEPELEPRDGAEYVVTISNVQVNGRNESFTYRVRPIAVE